MAILEALESHEGFTSLESDLADYILKNADAVVGMNISELSRASYTSGATIVRLCHKVGLDGYRSFRVGLAAEVERRRGQATEVDADQPFASGAGVKSVVASIHSLSKDALDRCYAAIDAYDVERVARAICSARHVFLFAHGDSELSCMAFANLLLKIGVHASIGNLYYESSAVAHSVQRDDVAMVVSYRGSAVSWMDNLVPILKARKARLVLVSCVPKPMGYDLSIRLPAKEALGATGKIATYYSQECIRFVLNCIYGEVYELTYEQSSRRKQAVGELEEAIVRRADEE